MEGGERPAAGHSPLRRRAGGAGRLLGQPQRACHPGAGGALRRGLLLRRSGVPAGERAGPAGLPGAAAGLPPGAQHLSQLLQLSQPADKEPPPGPGPEKPGAHQEDTLHVPKTTREKLLAYLMDQAKKQGSSEFVIPCGRQTLADYLGVERSAMSAELGRLKRDGLLDTKGSWFSLHLPEEKV